MRKVLKPERRLKAMLDRRQALDATIREFCHLHGIPIPLLADIEERRCDPSVERIVNLTNLGRMGGKAVQAKRTPVERAAAARKAVVARWKKYYEENPQPIRPRWRA